MACLVPSSSPRLRSMSAELTDLYLGLLKRCLTRYALEPEVQYRPYRTHRTGINAQLRLAVQRFVRRHRLELTAPLPVSLEARAIERSLTAETMIGLARLDQLHAAIKDILANDAGNLIETGMAGAGALPSSCAPCLPLTASMIELSGSPIPLKASPPNPESFPVDEGDLHSTYEYLAVGFDEVRANFAEEVRDARQPSEVSQRLVS